MNLATLWAKKNLENYILPKVFYQSWNCAVRCEHGVYIVDLQTPKSGKNF